MLIRVMVGLMMVVANAVDFLEVCESLILESVYLLLMVVAYLVVCCAACFQLRVGQTEAEEALGLGVECLDLVECPDLGVESCLHLDVTEQFDTFPPSTPNFDESAVVEQYGTKRRLNQCPSLQELQEHLL